MPCVMNNCFSPSSYLEKCKQQVVLQLAEIGESAWVTLALFVSCVMYFQAVFRTQNMNLFVVELFLALFPVVVAILVRLEVIAFSQLFIHPNHYYVMIEDGVCDFRSTTRLKKCCIFRFNCQKSLKALHNCRTPFGSDSHASLYWHSNSLNLCLAYVQQCECLIVISAVILLPPNLL